MYSMQCGNIILLKSTDINCPATSVRIYQSTLHNCLFIRNGVSDKWVYNKLKINVQHAVR